MENIIEDIDDEFDIQPSVLKKRNKDIEQKVYVEYDRMNNTVVSVSPIEIQVSNKRNIVQLVNQSDITNSLFNNKISLSKITIKRNKITDEFELEYNKPVIKSEFDYIFATTNRRSFIHIDCDVVSKNLEIVFDYEQFKTEFCTENLVEKELAEYPQQLVIYCIDSSERSRLYASITVSIKELFNLHSIRYPASWLPNDTSQLKNFGFVYYNNNQKISVGHAPKEIEETPKYKSNILYNQQGNVLKLQSNMQNITSFHVNEDITLYSYSKQDPTKMLGSYKISRDKFNNYNYFELTIKTSQPVKLISDCFHLQIEESNAYPD